MLPAAVLLGSRALSSKNRWNMFLAVILMGTLNACFFESRRGTVNAIERIFDTQQICSNDATGIIGACLAITLFIDRGERGEAQIDVLDIDRSAYIGNTYRLMAKPEGGSCDDSGNDAYHVLAKNLSRGPGTYFVVKPHFGCYIEEYRYFRLEKEYMLNAQGTAVNTPVPSSPAQRTLIPLSVLQNIVLLDSIVDYPEIDQLQ